jgi:hypothetical protein
VTVPVAADGLTVAVNVTLAPTDSEVLEAVSEVVVAVRLDDGVIVRVSGVDVLVASVEEPPYAAVTKWSPVVQKIADSVATPELRGAVPNAVVVVVSVNVMFPVADGATVAVRFTLSPVVSVPVVVVVSAVVVTVRLPTVSVTAADVLAA